MGRVRLIQAKAALTEPIRQKASRRTFELQVTVTLSVLLYIVSQKTRHPFLGHDFGMTFVENSLTTYNLHSKNA